MAPTIRLTYSPRRCVIPWCWSFLMSYISLFLLNFVVFECKFTAFCPILTTFVLGIRNIYKNRNDSASRNYAKPQVSRLSSGDQRGYATVAETALGYAADEMKHKSRKAIDEIVKWDGIHRKIRTIWRFPSWGADTSDWAFCWESDSSGVGGFVLRYVDEELHQRMKLKKRKIKYSAIFCICWFAVLVFLVDGVLKFQTLVDYFGSYALVEICLLLLVILPTLAVYRLTKE